MNPRTLIMLSLVAAQIYSTTCKEIEETTESFTNKQAIERSFTNNHYQKVPKLQGFWKKRFLWRPRWVKTWQEKKIYVAVWKRMWGPAEMKEWVPIPKPPPGWTKSESTAKLVKVGLPH